MILQIISRDIKGENRMKTGSYTGLSDERLAEIYKETGDEEAFKELLHSTEKLRFSLAKSYLNIPGSEMDDLMNEGAMEMMVAIRNYDSTKYTASFKSFLHSAISRRYNTMFRAATSVKRNAHGLVGSYEQINSNSEFDEDGDTLGNLSFSVECEEYSMVEVALLIETLGLSAQEKVVANLLLGGMDKPDIAKKLGVQTSSVHTYVKRIGKKINLSGAYA
jgi:RNA polymerase sigma factor (sigma-70 family)